MTANIILGAMLCMGYAVEDQVTRKVVITEIPFKTKYESNRSLDPGRTKTIQAGVKGSIKTTYELTYRNGKLVLKKPIFSTRKEPRDALVQLGQATRLESRGGYTRTGKVMNMVATGYDTSQQTIPGGTGVTASGIPAEFGICAVDPRVIPLGTRVYVEGYGEALCADTGGAIKGMRIDLCFDSRREALNWGRRKVKVHILGK